MINTKKISFVVVFSSLITLQGCSIAPHKKMDALSVNNSKIISTQTLIQEQPLSCIDELRSLTVLSPDDYNKLIPLFREVSEFNQIYKSVQFNANPDSLAIMKMTIESKTKVLCAKIKYYSVLSVEKQSNEISVL